MIPSSVMELVRAGAIPPSVRAIVMGGEPVTPSLARACLGLEGQPRVLNLYGTTEDTVHSTLFPVTEVSGDRIPVGVPIAGSRMYIARGSAELAPAGEVGEILLAGPKLALGYFGRPELTEERFVAMEVAPGQVERVYRTGDLGRLREDGLFECLGRLDSQVKVRGFRVEPEEISGSLCTCPGVADAAVLPEGDLSDRHLVAFVVPVKGETPEPEDLERWLRRSLPAYMVPSRWEYLDVLPRLPNGKLDRGRLSKLPAARSVAPAALAAGSVEARLAVLWSDVLGHELHHRNENFLRSGGHSLRAVQLAVAIEKSFGVRVDFTEVLGEPVFHELARRIETRMGVPSVETASGPDPADLEAAASLSPFEEQLWILDHAGEGGAYHEAIAVEMRGSLDPAALRAALEDLVRSHDALRTTFPSERGSPRRSVLGVADSEFDLPVDFVDAAAGNDVATVVDAWIRAQLTSPFDLGSGPLLRPRLLTVGSTRHVLLLEMHHIIVDDWSIGPLLRDLTAAYGRHTSGSLPATASTGTAPSSAASVGRRRMEVVALENELRWWEEYLDGARTDIGLPFERAEYGALTRSSAGGAGGPAPRGPGGVRRDRVPGGDDHLRYSSRLSRICTAARPARTS